MISSRLACLLSIALYFCGLTGCTTTSLPSFNTHEVDEKLNELSCASYKDDKPKKTCSDAFVGETQRPRELRLLRAYMLLEGAARYGAARFNSYSNAPADDAFQLMGSIASAVDSLMAAEVERVPTADKAVAFNSEVSYPVDKTVALFKIVVVLDTATKPVVRGVSMLALNSNVDRIKNAKMIIENAIRDVFFAQAYQESVANMVAMQTGPSPVPYSTAKGVVLSRLSARCLDLAKLANRTEHSCGNVVRSATVASGTVVSTDSTATLASPIGSIFQINFQPSVGSLGQEEKEDRPHSLRIPAPAARSYGSTTNSVSATVNTSALHLSLRVSI